MLRYIVSHLRERALSNDWQYISATIFDGLNNLKEKKTSFFWSRKKAAPEEAVRVSILLSRIGEFENCFAGMEEEHESLCTNRFSFKHELPCN